METYGASNAGGAFDFMHFAQQPQTISRVLSWVFAIIVFACITAEGYINSSGTSVQYCVFGGSLDACHYGVGIGFLAFLAATAFFILDIYFPQISNANERKYIVIADLVFSGVWSVLWFVGFCFLTNKWVTMTVTPLFGSDSARAVITFSFFSIFTWGLLAYFALRRYRQGMGSFPRATQTQPLTPQAAMEDTLQSASRATSSLPSSQTQIRVARGGTSLQST
ncbi:hypothetical protein AOXY_G15657, partial [Acipenser oxyrinchus oxyrinchus]